MRKSGSLDFYYDFKLVENYEAKPGISKCTAIDSDFRDLHFKLYEESEDPERKQEKSKDSTHKNDKSKDSARK